MSDSSQVLEIYPSKLHKLIKFAQNNYLLLLIFGSVLVRFSLVLNGNLALFNSGQDAPSYEAAALDFASKGFWSSEIESLPVWPAGYPYLLSFFILVFGENWWKFVVFFQHVLYLTSSVYFLKTIRNLMKKIQHFFLSCLILFLPSLMYSASENMYESVIASLLLIGVAASLSIFYSHPQNNPWKGYIVAIVSFGVAGFIQARTTPIGILILLLASKTLNVRSLFLAFISSWGLLLSMLRSWVAYGFLSPSVNFSIAIGASGTKFDSCTFVEPKELSYWDSVAYRDKETALCYFKFFLRNPSDFLSHILKEWRDLFGPLNGGGVQGASTWFHGLDFSRFAGFLGLNNLEDIHLIQNCFSIVLNFAILVGAFVMLKQVHWRVFLFFTSPIILNTLVHILSNGDSRYRLPILPFQILCLTYLTHLKLKINFDGRRFLTSSGKHNQSDT